MYIRLVLCYWRISVVVLVLHRDALEALLERLDVGHVACSSMNDSKILRLACDGRIVPNDAIACNNRQKVAEVRLG